MLFIFAILPCGKEQLLTVLYLLAVVRGAMLFLVYCFSSKRQGVSVPQDKEFWKTLESKARGLSLILKQLSIAHASLLLSLTSKIPAGK